MTTSPEPPTPSAIPPTLTGSPEVIFEWRGLLVTLPLVRLFAAFWLTIFVGSGCFWVILEPNNSVETNAAIAILSSVVTAWISALTRGR